MLDDTTAVIAIVR